MKIKLFSIDITSLSAKDILEYVSKDIQPSKNKYYIVTPNPEIIVYAHSHPDYQNILNQSRFSLCDGTGLYLASKILGKPVKERITGVAFLERLCQLASEKGYTIGFLGGRNHVANRAASILTKKYPKLDVIYISEDWKVSDNKKKIDILFVALGAPKQELWMHDHLKESNVRIMMGVGGAFDEISGEVRPVPQIIDRIGMKWLWRLLWQPWRLRRQRALLVFIWMTIKELTKKK